MDPNIPPQLVQTKTPVTHSNLQQPINEIPTPKNKWKLILIAIIFLIIVGIGGYMLIKDDVTTPISKSISTSTPSPTSITIPIRGVPKTSASAVTSPPSSMDGINTHTEVFGTDSDPKMITLGPKLGSHPEIPPYDTHHGLVFELKIHGTPVLAPIDMALVGFQNNSSYQKDGQNIIPMDDLVLFFESTSPNWPGMIIFVYHLSGSPLLLGHNIDPDCSAVEHPRGENIQAQGRLLMGMRDYVPDDKNNASACRALIGHKVKRGELVGFAGSVPNSNGIGTHSFVDIGFKVSDTSENPFFGLKGSDTSGERQDKTGNRYLHWVQPSSFFYWKSYSPDAIFPRGILAYPFETDGYQLPTEQRDINFKYTPKK